MRAFNLLLSRLGRLLDVRGREWPLLGIGLSHLALAMLLMTLLQSVHLGLLLNSFGRGALPLYFLAKGAFLLLISLFYSLRVIGRVSRQTEMLSFLALLGLVLLGSRILMIGSGPWEVGLYLGLSVFAEGFISMFTLQCWGLYSDIMDSRQSKRLMPLIGAGGTVGAMLGGWLASFLARPLGAENLLFVCFFLVSCLSLLTIQLLIRHLETPLTPTTVAQQPEGLLKGLQAILAQVFGHRLLLQFMLLIMCVKLGVNLAEYQQQVLLRESFGKDGITAFVGSWLAVTYLLALLFQILAENRLLQAFGPLFGLITTPLCLAAAAGGFLLSPTLLSNAIGRSAEQLTQKSIYKTSVNLVYLAFPSELRRRLRVVINGLLEFFAIVPFVAITLLLPALPLQGYSLGVLAAALLALGLVFALRKPYQQQLQSALQNHPLRQDEGEDPYYSAHSYAQLAESSLQSQDLTRLRFGLELLQRRRLPLPASVLEPLLEHGESAIRQLAAKTLADYGGPEQTPALLGRLAREPDPDVRRGLVASLGSWVDEQSNAALRIWLHDPDTGVRAETLVVLFLRGGIEGILCAGAELKALLRSDQAQDLKAATYVIGRIGSKYFRQDLSRLLDHEDSGVELEAIKAAGASPDPSWLKPLIERLARRGRGVQAQSRHSLQHFPAELLLPAIEQAYTHDEALHGVQGDVSLRRELIRTLEACPGPATLQLLLSWLQRADWRLKYPLLRVLNHLQAEAPGRINERVVYLEIQSVLREGFACLEVLWLLRRQQGKAAAPSRYDLLISELELWQRYTQELLFRLLALLYDPERINQAALNYASGEAHYRALSLDLLTQMLGRSLGPPVVHLLEDAPLDKKINFARGAALLAERHDSAWWERPLVRDHPQLRQLAAWCRYNPQQHLQTGADASSGIHTMLDTIYLLKQTPLFANLGLDQLEPVARVCRPQSCAAGQVVFAEGTPAKALYVIRTGQVTVEANGRQLATLKETDVFGEVEVLHAAPHLATIRALSDCEFLVISRQDFADLIEDYPAFAKGLVEILFERLRAAFERARTDQALPA